MIRIQVVRLLPSGKLYVQFSTSGYNTASLVEHVFLYCINKPRHTKNGRIWIEQEFYPAILSPSKRVKR